MDDHRHSGVAAFSSGGYVDSTGNHQHSAGTYVAGHTHSYATQANQTPTRFSDANLLSMLASRFGWGIDAKCAFRKIVPYCLNDEKIVLFIVVGDTAMVLEDDKLLYPSDALVTQLRLLAEVNR